MTNPGHALPDVRDGDYGEKRWRSNWDGDANFANAARIFICRVAPKADNFSF